VNEKGGKLDKKPYPFPFGLINPYINLKSENFQDYAQKKEEEEISMKLSVNEFGLRTSPPPLPTHPPIPHVTEAQR
jgi:hypothetical protein